MPTSHPHTSASSGSSADTSRRMSRANSDARDEIFTMLKSDHKRAKKAFRDFDKLDMQDEAACRELVTQTVAELEVHATLEEELFYPAVRNALSDDALVDEAEVEHMTFKTLINELKMLHPSDEKYAAHFKVLGEYVKHHIKEEENEMFQSLGRARLDWSGLLEEMKASRQDLMAQARLSEPASAKAMSASGKQRS